MKRTTAEFDARVGADGKIDVPEDILGMVGKGGRIRVRVTGAAITSALGRNGVDAEEVERIADLQRESHDQVIAFLLSEGALARGEKRTRRSHGHAGSR